MTPVTEGVILLKGPNKSLGGSRRVKIFVVDDSELDRKLLMTTLQKSGIENEFLQAEDGEVALEILDTESDNICLMFLDWQLPKVDGLEVLKRVAKNPKTENLPIIMVTSSSNPESEEIAQLLNPNLKAFVMKPLNPEQVVEVALPHIK